MADPFATETPPQSQDLPATGRPRVSLARLWPGLAIAASLALFIALDLDRFLSFAALKAHHEELIAWRDAHYALAALTFMLVYVVAVALSLPGALWLTISSGLLFGTAAGSVLAVIGATLGSSLLFLAARYACADFFHARAGGWLKRMEGGFQDNAFSYLLFLRLVPAFPFWLVNLVPALLGVGTFTFVAATALGIVPGTVIYASVGNGLGEMIAAGGAPDLSILFKPAVLGPLVALSLLSLAPVMIKRVRRRAQERRQ